MSRVYMALNSDGNEADIKDTIREIGEELYNTGGAAAMRGCFYLLAVAYRTMVHNTTSNKIKGQYQDQIYNLERCLEGIGEWKA